MTKKFYFLITGILFALITLVHLCRLVQGWEITVHGTIIPIWVSWIGLVISGALAYYGLRFGTRREYQSEL